MSFDPIAYRLAATEGITPRQRFVAGPIFQSLVSSSSSSSSSPSSSSASSASSSSSSALIRISPPSSPAPLHPPPAVGCLLTQVVPPPPTTMFGGPNLLHASYPRIAPSLHHHDRTSCPPPGLSAPIGGSTGPAFPPGSGGQQGIGQFMSTINTSSSAFYSPINGESVERWRTSISGHVTGPNTWSSFDPTALVTYPYGSIGALDVRRKNATRESTSTLKAWLFEHIKNPYPTKGEKIMLAIITKMTLTQVSTWFANARRRLKKENKMQWPPRQRPNDDDDDDDEDEDRNSDENDDVIERGKNDVITKKGEEYLAPSPGRSDDNDDDDDGDVIVDTDFEENEDHRCSRNSSPSLCSHQLSKANEFPGVETPLSPRLERKSSSSPDSHQDHPSTAATLPPSQPQGHSRGQSVTPSQSSSPTSLSNNDGVKVKPRIWSLVDTATSGRDLPRPEVGGRLDERLPVGRFCGWGDGAREGGLHSWMSTAFHSSVEALSHSIVHPGFYNRPTSTGSHVRSSIGHQRSPPPAPPSATLVALNGGLFYRELSTAHLTRMHLDRKRHFNAVTAAPPTDQSIDV